MAEPSAEDLVIIGYAAQTCLGDENETFRRALDGESGFTNLRQAGHILENVPENVSTAEVGGIIPDGYDSLRDPGYRDADGNLRQEFKAINRDRHRVVQIATDVGVRAIRHAGLFADKEGLSSFDLDPEKVPDSRRIGVFMGTGIGGALAVLKMHERVQAGKFVNPHLTLQTEPERIASVLSKQTGTRGPLATFVGACASGNMSPLFAEAMLALNKADYMVVGGAESSMTPEIFAGFSAMTALDREKDEKRASRPYDKTRDGFVPAEGGGAIVITKRRIAEAIGAKIHAEFIGSGLSSDAFHDTAPDPEGTYAAYAMEQAMDGVVEYLDGDKDAEGYISTHGTATPNGDGAELKAMGQVEAIDQERVHVSSLKAMVGHMIGGAAAAELVMCVMLVSDENKEKLVIPSVHIDDPDWEIIGDWRMNIGQAVKASKVRWALNNSFGFGGYNYVTAVGSPR